MGQKVNPTGFRTGVIYDSKSVWFADKKNYSTYLLEDASIRKFLVSKLTNAGLTHVEIKRSINNIDIYLHISRPGVVIGRGGAGLEALKKDLEKLVFIKSKGKTQTKINLHPVEVKTPHLSAALVAERI